MEVKIKELKLGRVEDLMKEIQKLINECEPPEVYQNDDVNYFLEKLAIKWNWPVEKVVSYLNKLGDLYPMLSIQMVLKVIARELDANYPGHIKDAEHIYAISTGNGDIIEVNKSKIKNFNNFAAFRTVEDAEYAKEVLKEQFDAVFND